MNYSKKPVLKICFDGGPCAGKSTGLSAIAEYLVSMGYIALTTPESATELMSHGVNVQDNRIFQKLVLRRTLDNENYFSDVAHALMTQTECKGAVVLCDRGAMSGKAYMSNPDEFINILAEFGLEEVTARNQRYELVIHMCSSACGREEIYEANRRNNPTRRESVKEAKLQDAKTIEAWTGHHDLAIVDNASDSFHGKLNTVIGVVARKFGMPTPCNEERKYLVRPDFTIPVNAVKTYIRQLYLGPEEYVRSMSYDCGNILYFHTQKQCIPSATRSKVEKMLSQKEYVLLVQGLNRDMPYIEKNRYFFVYESQYFRLDVFRFAGSRQLTLLEVQPTTMQKDVVLPPFLPVIKEVTDDLHYYNYHIACENMK